MKYTNAQIRDFIRIVKRKEGYVAKSYDKALIRGYNECDDYNLSEELIDKIWSFIREKHPLLYGYDDRGLVYMMHTNAGSGKIFEKSPKNCSVVAYNNDIYCKHISDLLNQSKSVDSLYSSEIFDISNYFILGDSGNNQRYDIVFTQVSEKNDYYKGIDDTNLSKLPPKRYYVARSLDFVAKGGYICILCNKKDVNEILSCKEVKSKSYHERTLAPINSKSEYIALMLKKK